MPTLAWAPSSLWTRRNASFTSLDLVSLVGYDESEVMVMAEQIELTVVVNGQAATISANPDEDLQAVVVRALDQTKNQGQPPSNWELRDSSGGLLDFQRKVGSLGPLVSQPLFLSLRAGIGG